MQVTQFYLSGTPDFARSSSDCITNYHGAATSCADFGVDRLLIIIKLLSHLYGRTRYRGSHRSNRVISPLLLHNGDAVRNCLKCYIQHVLSDYFHRLVVFTATGVHSAYSRPFFQYVLSYCCTPS
jgi:hypothetical protein